MHVMVAFVWFPFRSSVIVVKEEKRKTAKKRGGPQSQQQHCSGPKDHGTDAPHGKDGNPKHKSTKKHKEHAKTGKVPVPGRGAFVIV